jgi:hypothetical protein
MVLRGGSFVALVFGVIGLAGCDSKPPPAPCFPVSGKVTHQKQPLMTGNIYFTPDATKGNSSKEVAFGFIASDGGYSLTTNGREGAPLGWYKVSIDPFGMPKESPSKDSPPPKPATINAKYKKADTSGISIEVTETPKPGAYDIELK